MQRVLFLLSFLFLIYHPMQSQSSGKSAFYLEVASAPTPYSINFETQIKEGKTFIYAFRVGGSLGKDVLAIPLGIHAYTKHGAHHFEWSLVAMPYINHYQTIFKQDGLTDTYLYVIPGLGYRYQRPQGRWFARAAVHPMIEMDPPSTNIFDVEPKFLGGISAAVGIRL